MAPAAKKHVPSAEVPAASGQVWATPVQAGAHGAPGSGSGGRLAGSGVGHKSALDPASDRKSGPGLAPLLLQSARWRPSMNPRSIALSFAMWPTALLVTGCPNCEYESRCDGNTLKMCL